jgi:uncharacterized protein
MVREPRITIEFEWDEAKSGRNFELRGFDFEFGTALFDNPVAEKEDHRRDYGEQRIVATGMIGGRLLHRGVYASR